MNILFVMVTVVWIEDEYLFNHARGTEYDSQCFTE